jgi:acyl carrier protein
VNADVEPASKRGETMNSARAPYAVLLVQLAIARYLRVAPGEVRARHRLQDDLGLDAFDVALVAVGLSDQLGVDVPLDDVDDAATVAALAGCFARALEEDERRRALDGDGHDDEDEGAGPLSLPYGDRPSLSGDVY